MNKASMVSLVLGALMLSSSALTTVLTPTLKIADRQQKFSLETLVPARFDGWEIDGTVTPVQVSPDVQAKLDAIYNQTLARTYVNRQGERVMLSIAYGGDQSGEGTQVHRPEFCYAAQGFDVGGNVVATLATPSGPIPVRRLLARQGTRAEPITYWLTVGDKPTLPGFGRMWTQISYGLNGVVPDGMLVRVSSIDPDTPQAYKLHDQFINSLLASLGERERIRLTGKLND